MEDTADSEADSVRPEVSATFGSGDDGDDGDAESCSCDGSEVSGSRADVRNDRDTSDQWKDPCQRSSVVWTSDPEDGHLLLDVDEEEESWVDSGGTGSGGGDLSKEEMDAMEDKVFWETCMAIGYP
ncbi:hypothetical protein ACJRO7_032235 [Eucalyptus globulus]|uniref:Uncharacterized protein n=1 Tax=Eucalyptus globulus TaxID=34317 RepID=A0ABD3JKK1_EUCGL